MRALIKDLRAEMKKLPLVPLVLVFTMFDLIVPKVSSNTAGVNDYESARAMAHTKCEVHRRSLSGNVRAEIVSSNILSYVLHGRVVSPLGLFSAQPKFHDYIEKLAITTDQVITAHSRNISASPGVQRTQPGIFPVTLAWSVSQRASRDINIQASIERVNSFLLLNLFSHFLLQSWAKQ